MSSALDHIEKTLADGYRREIEQGENVWRSLPFFAATIAFQIAALSQVLLRLPPASSGAFVSSSAAHAAGGAVRRGGMRSLPSWRCRC